jgi:monofunctional biosynthetic peptidoglycan transglycosylase
MGPWIPDLAGAVRRGPWRTALLAGTGGLLAASGILWASLPDVSGLTTGWPRTTAYMELRIREAREAGRSLDLRYRPVSLERIPDHLQHAVRMGEDVGFYGHDGVDWAELRIALAEAWSEQRPPRGASTITQQLARNLYLSPSRTPWRKLRELFVARRLERELSKRRILELYLNVIELGDGIFGVDAAARRYFGVPVWQLTPARSLQIAATIPSPRTHNPATDTRRFRWRVDLIGRRLRTVVPDTALREPPDPQREPDSTGAPSSSASMRLRCARYSGREARSRVSAERRNRSMWASLSSEALAARAARR